MTFTPWKARAAALVSALLLAAAFPPLNWWPLALVALVPLLLAVWSISARHSKLVPALRQEPNPPGEPAGGPGGSAHAIKPQGRDGLVTDSVKTTPGPETQAPVFWPAFRLGWQFGFVFFLATLWWIQYVTLPGMLALTAYLALYPALAFGLVAWLHPGAAGRGQNPGKLALGLGVWCGLEWVRSVALSGFPWHSLAVPLFDLSSARLLAAWTGVIGLSGMVFLVHWMIARAILRNGGKSWRIIAVGTAMGVLIELVVRFLTAGSGGTEAVMHRAILIQPNVTMEEKMSPDPEVQRQRYFDLLAQTDEALAQADGPAGRVKPGLVVWPESAVPGFFNDMVNGGAFTEQLQQGDFSLVTGADHEEWGELYNSIAVLRGTVENHALHPKVRLVPFGEFIPFRREVPLFEKMLGGLIPMDFTPGTNLEPMRVKGQPFSIVPLVCFEDTIGNHARKFIRPEPQIIVNVTNDNWFHESPATEMHFVNARWRAAELDRALLRSANTGVTAIVSPQGNVQRIPSHLPGTLHGNFQTGNASITFYAAHGDLFSQGAGASALLGYGAIWWKRRRSRSPAVARSS
jgi:apolipoprotein N-acyltransferase